MACDKHPNMSAVARCEQCGREICAACTTQARGKVVCRDCADVLRSQPEPEPPAADEATSSEGPSPGPTTTAPPQGPIEGTAPSGPAHDDKPSGPVLNDKPSGPVSGVPATVTPSAITPSAPSPPPALPDPGTGGPREKESILSAALSLLLPGAGQIYNGQVAKGIILAALYVGSIAIIFGGAVVTVLSASYFGTSRNMCCCCLPLFILPLILLVYAIFDAYNTAEKINNHEPVKDWL